MIDTRKGETFLSRLTARTFGGIIALAAAASAFGAPAPDDAMAYVSVSGDELRADGAAARFLCATGVAVPMPDPAPGGDAALWRTNWLAAAHAGEALAARLRDAGFDMIRLGALPTGESSIQGNFTLPELHDLFIHACKANGLRIWAEVMHPATRRPATAADADCLDDPATAAAWTNAIAATPAPDDQMLAAPWDPRLEVLLQRRIREWARSFNPYTGLRRCDDPVFALWSFEQLWWDDIQSPNRQPLHPFFRTGLDTVWNNWLYEHFPNDGELRRALPDLDPDESVERGTVRRIQTPVCPVCASAKPPRNPCPRRAMQDKFLLNLYAAHLLRIVAPFAVFGESTRLAPTAISYNARHDNLPVGATARFVAPGGDAHADSPIPGIRIADPAGQADLYVATAAAAISDRIGVLALPPCDSPASSIFASHILRAGQAPDPDGRIDLPGLAFVQMDIPTNGAHCAFNASTALLTNIVLFAQAPRGVTNIAARTATGGRLVFAAAASDNMSFDRAKTVVATVYAYNPATGERLDPDFFIAFPGIGGKAVEATDIEGRLIDGRDTTANPARAEPPTDDEANPPATAEKPAVSEPAPPPIQVDALHIGAGTGVFRLRFANPRRKLDVLP